MGTVKHSIILGASLGLFFALPFSNAPKAMKPTKSVEISRKLVVTLTPSPTPASPAVFYRGTASYYSRQGCVGCSEGMIMANGQPLDDGAMTVAYNRASLGSVVKVKNVNNGLQVVATVTDTGGFERIGRIIDLTLAVKQALACNDLCQVEVTHLP